VLVGDPSVLLLDEPTTGLDPTAARNLRDLVRELASQGRPVLFSTHNLAEAADLADSVLLLGHGALLGQGPVSEIVGNGDTHRLSVVGSGPIEAVSAARGWSTARVGRWWEIRLPAGIDSGQAVADLVAGGVSVREVHETENALEDIYAELSHD
jgi:ABC-2 type transport system ATP-binding protein